MATKEQRQRRLAKGVCVNCASKPPIENETLCQPCKEQKKKHNKKYLEKKRQNRICLNCNNPAMPRKSLCLECKEKQKKYKYDTKKYKKERKSFTFYDQLYEVERKVYKNIIGEKYDQLEVIEYSHRSSEVNHWICKCDCGELLIVAQNHLKVRKSCGCKNEKQNVKVIDKKTLDIRYLRNDLKGKIYGKFEVIEYSHRYQKKDDKRNFWVCKCVECNAEKIISSNQLIKGKFSDCKCDNKIRLSFQDLLDNVVKKIKSERN